MGTPFARRWSGGGRVGVLEQGKDAGLDLVRSEGLAEVAAGSGGEGAEDEGLAGLRGDHDDGDAGREVLGGAALKEGEAIHAGHVDVGEDEVERWGGTKELEGFGSVAGLEDVELLDAGLAKGALDDLSHNGGVVDDECAHGDLGGEALLVLSAGEDGTLVKAGIRNRKRKKQLQLQLQPLRFFASLRMKGTVGEAVLTVEVEALVGDVH